MAATSLQSIHHNPLAKQHHHFPPPLDSSPSSSLFIKPTTLSPSFSFKLSSHFTTFSNSLTTSSSTPIAASSPISFDLLDQHLAAQNFREADEETRRLLIALAGEAAVKRGYVFFSEVQFIPDSDLRAVDSLWGKYSNGKFGYSVQKRIWEKSKRDFTNFFMKVGWMKKLDTEMEQFNYRAFPEEFLWEMKDDTPMGHLPLTNALRGTRLLSSIFAHPVFQVEEEERGIGANENGIEAGKDEGRQSTTASSAKRSLKTDYSF